MITPSVDFTVAIKVWMNGQAASDQSLVKTRFPDVGLGGSMYLTHNAYGSGLTPTPAHHYVDEVTISLDRFFSKAFSTLGLLARTSAPTTMAALNVVRVATILAALFVARAGYAVTPAWDAPAAAPASLSVGEARRNAGSPSWTT